MVKTWYNKLRETIPPKDPRLRKKFYEEKVGIHCFSQIWQLKKHERGGHGK